MDFFRSLTAQETNDRLHSKALQNHVYYPPYKEENALETIKVNEYDLDKIKESVRDSVEILSYNTNYKPMILEILDILHQNRSDFLVDQQKYISFYWSGMLVLRIIIEKEVPHNKQMHISMQKYQSSKEDLIREKKMDKIILAGLGGAVVFGGILAGVALFRSGNSPTN